MCVQSSESRMFFVLACIAAVFAVLGLKKRSIVFCVFIVFYYAFHRPRKNPPGAAYPSVFAEE